MNSLMIICIVVLTCASLLREFYWERRRVESGRLLAECTAEVDDLSAQLMECAVQRSELEGVINEIVAVGEILAQEPHETYAGQASFFTFRSLGVSDKIAV